MQTKMRHLFLLVFLGLICSIGHSQPPALIPYQAIARDATGNAVLNQNIGLRFSIHDQTITGSVIWQEAQTVLSSPLGVVVTSLGSVSDLSTVNWAQGDKFLQVEMDIAGGTNYSDMGTQQMMSVPYALYAGQANQLTTNNGSGFSHWIGEYFGGGVIFHLWKGLDGTEHGLILDIVNLSDGAPWSNVDDVRIGGIMDGFGLGGPWDGMANSMAIISQAGHTSSAALICLNSTNSGYDNWYLPSRSEWQLVYNHRREIARSLVNIPGADLSLWDYNSLILLWTSDEGYPGETQSNMKAKCVFLNTWEQTDVSSNSISKNSLLAVRAIRSF